MDETLNNPNPMKFKKMLFRLAITGAMTLATAKVSAFPLYLTSLNGSISSTANYGSTDSTTSNRASLVSINLSKMLTVVSNQVFLDTGVNPPGDAKIALEPSTLHLYLTNSSGYFQDLTANHEASFRIRDIATTFATNGLTESDRIIADLDLFGTGADGLYYEFRVRGSASLVINVNSGSGVGVMSINMAGSNGSGYGSYKSSDDGVSVGGFSMKGSGTPEWNSAYSVYWSNNLR